MISEFFDDSKEKNVFTFETLLEEENDDEEEEKRSDKSTINAFISSIQSVS